MLEMKKIVEQINIEVLKTNLLEHVTNCRSTSSNKALTEALKCKDVMRRGKHKQDHEAEIIEPLIK